MVVPKKIIDRAENYLGKELKDSILNAKKNIVFFHKKQLKKNTVIETAEGVKCWQKSVPIDRVGIYINRERAPLFSSILMLAIPAKLAGCKEIILCIPPEENGKIPAVVLFTAKIAGVTKIFNLGGIQAIGAIAYGTESIPRVCKILGTGDKNSNAIKNLLTNTDIAIDIPEDPTELTIIADENSNPAYIAADILSQAEHGGDTQLAMITCDEKIIYSVKEELISQYKKLTSRKYTKPAIDNCKLIMMNDMEEVIDFVNDYAPEHLIIDTKDYKEIAEKIHNAGSVFLGKYSPQSAGDYAVGTNHNLPRAGCAKSFSAVSIDSFMKKITFQELNKKGLKNLSPVIDSLATAEKMFAHKNAVDIRFTQ